MKLLTIGDSISQGFMSLAAARTDLSYSTIMAKALGLIPGVDYPVPSWPVGGLPINLERVLRRLQRDFGPDIAGPIEWAQAITSINGQLDEVEDYYERGGGAVSRPQAGPITAFPNLAVAGFTAADAWKVTHNSCMQTIADGGDGGNDFFGLPSHRFERTAAAVLNPSRGTQFTGLSQLGWLERHAPGEGVETLALWLGSNHALGTIVDLKISDTGTSAKDPLEMTVAERNKFNLWSEKHFKAEFKELLGRVHELMMANKAKGWTVLVGTVPPITVAPLAKGVGNDAPTDDPFGILPSARYFDYYTYVPFNLDFARRTGRHLSRDDALTIDRRVAAYNRIIKDETAAMNTKAKKKGGRYVLVDIAGALLQLAFKRNGGQPTYPLPAGLIRPKRPIPNTIYYHVTREAQMTQGGIFSVDGVHPSAIGQSLLAREFLKGLTGKDYDHVDRMIDWNSVVASDSLFTNPIALMPEIYDNTRLAELLLKLFV